MFDWFSLPDINPFSSISTGITSVVSIIFVLIALYFLRHIIDSFFRGVGDVLHKLIREKVSTGKGLLAVIAGSVFVAGGTFAGVKMYLNAPEYALEADAADIQVVYDMTAEGECQFTMAQPGNIQEETFRMKRTGESFEKEFTIETVKPRGWLPSKLLGDFKSTDKISVTKEDALWEHRGYNDDDFMSMIQKISAQTCDTPSQDELVASESESDPDPKRVEEVADAVTPESEEELEEVVTTDSEESDEKSGFTKVLEKVKFW